MFDINFHKAELKLQKDERLNDSRISYQSPPSHSISSFNYFSASKCQLLKLVENQTHHPECADVSCDTWHVTLGCKLLMRVQWAAGKGIYPKCLWITFSEFLRARQWWHLIFDTMFIWVCSVLKCFERVGSKRSLNKSFCKIWPSLLYPLCFAPCRNYAVVMLIRSIWKIFPPLMWQSVSHTWCLCLWNVVSCWHCSVLRKTAFFPCKLDGGEKLLRLK